MTTPVVDVFAGPGGLAEGFSSLTVRGRKPFRVALSIEKDARAHETLLLRGFFRQFPDKPPEDYWRLMRGEIGRQELFERYPQQFALAERECVRHELGPKTDDATYELVRKALAGHDGPWGLIGGPPCQAYSLVGRSRNRGVVGYVPEQDHRQTLYVEYLRILSDHRPAFFVMENVKGLLSATLQSSRIFERILSDLQDPTTALKRENRSARSLGSGPKYRLVSLARPASALFGLDPDDVIIRSENYGVPQARHRVIILGIRDDVRSDGLRQLTETDEKHVRTALKGLPGIRSGITDQPDTDAEWCARVASFAKQPWFSHVDSDVRHTIRDAVSEIRSFRAGRGGEFVRSRSSACGDLSGFANHSSRAHIAADLERYFFAACFATARGRSATLDEFPTALLPNHANAASAVHEGLFSDRFRVQVWNRPATTITSHISKDGHYYIHPDATQCRSLTVREAARLQTFPDSYFFCGPRTSQYHQVGNAVPPELARQIAEVVSELV